MFESLPLDEKSLNLSKEIPKKIDRGSMKLHGHISI